MKNKLNLNDAEMESFASAATEHNIEKHLRSKYDKILADKKKNTLKKNSIINISTIIKVAAVVVAVVGSTLLFNNGGFSTSSVMMAENFLAQTNIPGNPEYTRKGSVSADEMKREANDYFVLKNYPAAIEKYNELKSLNGLSLMDQFYVGVSFMKIKKFGNAIPIFSSIKSNGNNQIEEVDWLLSLAYVLSDQSENAVPILKSIISDNRYKTKEAKKLLNKIK